MRVVGILAILGVGILSLPAALESPGLAIARAAATQIGQTIYYDPAYVRLAYPGGDVPRDRGVCTDVVIRALREASGLDLQQLVHEDIKSHGSDYPALWGLKGPDRNIDHRRVPNLRKFFERQGWALKVTRNESDYQAGDLVTCTVPPHLPHIMVVSACQSETGRPLVIHNIGQGVLEEDRLFEFPITGHYRVR